MSLLFNGDFIIFYEYFVNKSGKENLIERLRIRMVIVNKKEDNWQ